MASVAPILPSLSDLPVKEIPGSYGPPFFGALRDRLDFFYKQGQEEFFVSRMKKYNSTVFRVNMPPGGLGFPDPRVIMLLDQRSFPVLFDTSRVDKRDVFTGTYTPPPSFTGGFRVLPYLDPSEERHAKLKGFCMEILRSKASRWFPEFHRAFGEACVVWEDQLQAGGKANFSAQTDDFVLKFLCRSILDQDPCLPGEAALGEDACSHISKWIGLQLHPLVSLGLPSCLDDLLLHSVQLPFSLVQKNYQKIYAFFKNYGKEIFAMADAKFDLDREDALHNLIFFVCFNTHGGIRRLFPSIIKHISNAGAELQQELAEEVQAAIKSHNGLNPKALNSMPLVESTIHEVLRIEPPVPFQYGRAKHDQIIESHDAAHMVKKGELLGGCQPLATRDPKVFKQPNTFLPKRFLGEEGQRLLRHVLWSNGPETSHPSISNKQCAGKDFIVLISRLFVAELFGRYDRIKLESQGKGISITYFFSSLEKHSA